jgi:hypothetical protein
MVARHGVCFPKRWTGCERQTTPKALTVPGGWVGNSTCMSALVALCSVYCTALTGGSDAAGCGFVAIRARRNNANDALRASWLRAHSAIELNACHHRATLGKANLTNLFGPMVSAAPEVSDHLCSNPSSRPPPTPSSSPPRLLSFTENVKGDFPKNI